MKSRKVVDKNKHAIIMELNSIEEQCKELQDVISTLNSKFI